MKKRGMAVVVSAILGIVFSLCLTPSGYAEEEFMLEAITVTAEKRSVNIQNLPMSVVAVDGPALAERGKITTTQILEDIPNVHFVYNSDQDDENPAGNIWIRGVKATQETGGGNPPASTATYVDGVYEGIGGNYDLNRVEVLRGPQGTLYGRSATGGVVAFYTNDPKLEEFGGSASLEVGEANLLNAQAAVNIPLGDKFALRVAGHYYEKDGYYNPEGDYIETKEGRIKALYEPTDKLDMILNFSATKKTDGSGGNTATLSAPGEIDYNGVVTDTAMTVPDEYLQGSLTINYDFDQSTLTYIGAVHTYDATGFQGINATNMGVQTAYWDFPTDLHHTEEIRLASNTDGPFSWLLGANYYSQDYEKSNTSIQVYGYDANKNIDPDTYDVDLYTSTLILDIKNYGLFTEETYEINDNFRVTGGLRYDWTEIVQTSSVDFNQNIDANFNSLNPAEWVYFALEDEKNDYSNITYKLRFEYDVTPDNMLYAMTATGVLPGITQVSPQTNMDWATLSATVDFVKLPFEEIELTSYEIGSKNRFLNNRLELNAAAFFYDYEGYQEALDTAEGGLPQYVVLSVPVEMLGLEVDATWLLTQLDKVSLTAGWLSTEITDFPYIEENDIGDSSVYAYLDEITGVPEFTATIGYDHTFYLTNGSSIVPRVEYKFTKGHYLEQITEEQVAFGALAYNYQDDYSIVNFGTTWTSPTGMYTVTGYIRNLFDEEYINNIELSTDGTEDLEVEVGEPQAWGLSVAVKF